jgi:hypothetical protein
MALLEPFLESMVAASAPSKPDDIARLLCRCVVQACSDLDLAEAEIYSDGATVTIFPTHATAWEAVVAAPDAYRLYPGVMEDDGETVAWANSTENFSLQKLVEKLEHELSQAAG